MKKIILSFTVIITLSLLLFSACKKGKEVLSPENKQKLTEQNRSAAHRGGAESDGGAQAFFDAYGPQYEYFTIDPKEETRIQLRGGTVLTIPPGAYTIDGEPVTDLVNFKAIEFTNRGEMALRGINTMSGKTMLESDGSFDFKVTVGDDSKQVDASLAPGKVISLLVPDREGGGNTTNMYSSGTIEVAGQDGTVQQQFNWSPAIVPGQPGNIRSENGTFPIIWNIISGPNCDDEVASTGANGTARQNRAPQFTTLKVDLPNNPGAFAGYQGSGGGNTYVLFVPKKLNTLVQLYNTTTTHVESFPNSIPVDMNGRILAYSVVGGNYYLAIRDIVTSGPTQSFTLDLMPADPAELVAALNSLSTY